MVGITEITQVDGIFKDPQVVGSLWDKHWELGELLKKLCKGV